MTESKLKRMIVALTVGAVLLLVCLLSVMVYQLVAIGKQEKELSELNAKIEQYRQMIEDGEDTLEVRSTRQWIIREARQLGYIFDGDKIYPND
jgi:cell division protein FtsL